MNESDAEVLIVGKYTITRWINDDYYIGHYSGEGMQISKDKFEKLIDDFYKDEF